MWRFRVYCFISRFTVSTFPWVVCFNKTSSQHPNNDGVSHYRCSINKYLSKVNRCLSSNAPDSLTKTQTYIQSLFYINLNEDKELFKIQKEIRAHVYHSAHQAATCTNTPETTATAGSGKPGWEEYIVCKIGLYNLMIICCFFSVIMDWKFSENISGIDIKWTIIHENYNWLWSDNHMDFYSCIWFQIDSFWDGIL